MGADIKTVLAFRAFFTSLQRCIFRDRSGPPSAGRLRPPPLTTEYDGSPQKISPATECRRPGCVIVLLREQASPLEPVEPCKRRSGGHSEAGGGWLSLVRQPAGGQRFAPPNWRLS